MRDIGRRVRALMLVTIVMVVIVVPSAVQAGAPHLVSYQGFLRDTSGAPVDGTIDLECAVYDGESAGAILWAEDQPGVPVARGVFHVMLGSMTALDPSVFGGADAWLETVVDGVPLAPRHRFLAAPYAMRSSVAELSLVASDDTDWQIDGQNLYHVGGTVAIGTTTPEAQPLDVAGDVTIGGGTEGVTDGVAEWVLISGLSGQWYLGARNSATVEETGFFMSGGTASLAITRNGDIGLGTDTPASKLDVTGTVEAEALKVTRNLGESAVPAPGGLYRDNVICAWAHVAADGTILEDFGMSGATYDGDGSWNVYMDRSLSEASVTVSPDAEGDLVVASASVGGNRIIVFQQRYVDGFAMQPAFNDFFITVLGRP